MESISTFFKIENDPLYRLGYAEGLKEARARRGGSVAIEVARRMKKDNMPIEQISRYIKLSIEEIEKL